jgi:outer membrane immunogenic protein
MRTSHFFSLAAIAFSFGVSQASFAADLPVKAPVYRAPVAVSTWSGCYIGGQVGYGWARDRLIEIDDATGTLSAFSPADKATPSGILAGGMAGCNWQWSGPWVIGIEGDGEWTDINGSVIAYPGTGTPPDTYEARIRWQASIRGRLGYAFDRNLLYVTGGAAFANIRHVYTSGGLSEDFSKTQTGWTVGGGWEYAFMPNWTARIEYRYSDFGTVTNVPTVVWTGFTENHDVVEHAVRFGVTYRFTGLP